MIYFIRFVKLINFFFDKLKKNRLLDNVRKYI